MNSDLIPCCVLKHCLYLTCATNHSIQSCLKAYFGWEEYTKGKKQFDGIAEVWPEHNLKAVACWIVYVSFT